MAKLQIVYDASSEIEQLIQNLEQHMNLKKDEREIFDLAQKILQLAFDEGRRFQKQISINSNTKDSICFKSEI